MAEGVQVQYTREMRQQFGYTAAWLPTADVRLGDVGQLHGYEYVRLASLADFGLTFDERSGRSTAMLEYTSAHAVSVSLKASGDVPAGDSALGKLDAGIAVSFTSGGATMFQARNCLVTSIADQHALGQQLVDLYAAGEWPDDYVVVTTVVSAERATVLVSSGGGALVELSAGAAANLGLHSLVDVDAGLRAVRSRNMAVQVVGEGGLTPLLQAWGVARPWFSRPRAVRRGGTTQRIAPEDKPVFGEVDYENFAQPAQ